MIRRKAAYVHLGLETSLGMLDSYSDNRDGEMG